MSIPSIVLVSKNIIPIETVKIHQKFSKDLLQAATRSPKKKQNIKIVKESNYYYPSNVGSDNMRSEIYNWFFNLDIPTRVAVSSIQNKWLVKITSQLWRLYFYDSWHQFVPSINMKEFFPELEIEKKKLDFNELNDLNFYPSFFDSSNSTMYHLSEKNKTLMQTEREFLDYIKFITTTEENDTITLDPRFLSNQVKFKIIMEALTEGSFLKYWPFPKISHDYQVYNFVFPHWSTTRLKFTVGQILIIYFEQIILLNYEYYYYTKQIYPFPQNEIIKNIFDENEKIRKFLFEETSEEIKKKEIFFNVIDFNSIESEVKGNMTYKTLIYENKEIKDRVYGRYYSSQTYGGDLGQNQDCMDKIKDELKKIFLNSTENFIISTMFLGFQEIFEYSNFVYRQTYKAIYDMYIVKNVDCLINNEDNYNVNSNKKKKHKKKKKKEKKTETKDENINDKPQQQNDNIKKEEITISNENLLKELESIDNDHNQNTQSQQIQTKPKKKEKKKQFHLYQTIPKKKKKNNEIQKEKTNDQDKKEKSNSEISQESTITSNSKNQNFPQPQVEFTHSTYQLNEEKPNIIYPNFSYPNQPIIVNSFIYQCNFFNSFPPFQMPSKSFFDQLSQEIIKFNKDVENNIKILKQYRLSYLEKIQNLIMKGLEDNYIIEFYHYGSFQTELAIESSDIDILTKFTPKNNEKNNSELFYIIKEIDNYLNQNPHNKLFDYIKPIYTATVPVIKLQCDIGDIIPKKEKDSILSEYLFTQDEILKIKFDIIFQKKEDNISQISPLQSVDFVKNSLLEYPEIKPLILIMKRYMKVLKLNNSFKGGLSSYSLFLLLFSFIKKERTFSLNKNEEHSYGKEMFDFLGCYSFFDFDKYIIKPGDKTPYILDSEKHEGQIVILDPVTNLNVSKSSFKVDEIKLAFNKAFEYLKFSSFRIQSEKKHTNSDILTGMFFI